MSASLSYSPADPLRAAAVPLRSDHLTLGPLLEWMGGSSLVLIGEGTCGTYEFQRARIAITQRLIEERGFTAVGIEADWHAVRALNRFVRGRGRSSAGLDAMEGLNQFPSWRWRNGGLLGFAGWLRAWNETLPVERQVGFYGLDLFGVESIRQLVIDFFDESDPRAAARLRQRSSLPPGMTANLPLDLTAELKEQVIVKILHHHHAQSEALMHQRQVDDDDYFFLVENARLSRVAEDFFQSLLVNAAPFWQVRVTHIAEVIDALLAHQRRFGVAKMVVWSHNALVGDARATEALEETLPSLGQLVRERYAGHAYLIGQTTDHGTLAAARGWGQFVERCALPEAPIGSFERLLHQCGHPWMMLNLHGDDDASDLLREPMLERIAGAVLPHDLPVPTVMTRPADQFDAVLHFDETRAIEPL